MPINQDIIQYNERQNAFEVHICDTLSQIIDAALPTAENKIWHAHPVWFIDGNPIVGYSKQKAGIRLMFWSGASFNEENLNIVGGKFKDASIFYTQATEIQLDEVNRWLQKSVNIQWDYKNIVIRKGVLLKLELDYVTD